MRFSLVGGVLLLLPLFAQANEAWRGFCEVGNQSVVTSGISSATKVQRSYPQCTVTIFVHGGGLATIYSDNNLTPLANPFQANLDGSFVWYAANGRYDQQISSANIAAPFTFLDILLCDPAALGACGTLASGVTTLNTLTGDLTLIAGSNITITPTSSSTLVIASTGGGGGCTLPGTDTGVLSEHPVGTCYNSLDWTWDDTNFVNRQGDGTNTVSGTNTLAFSYGKSNSQAFTTRAWAIGDANAITCDTNTVGAVKCYDLFNIGRFNTITDTGVSSSNFFNFVYGEANIITVTGGATGSDFLQLLRANTIQSLSAGGVDDVGQLGKSNSIQSTGTNSITSSTFQIGENNTANSSAGGNNEDNVQLGENNTLQATAATSVIGFMAQLGYTNNFFTSTVGVQVNYGFAVGHANNNSDGSGATTNQTDFGMVGHNLHMVNCSDCFAFGKNIDQSTSNTVYLGMSATPELALTAGHTSITGHLDQSVTKSIAGTCAMSAGTSCTWTLTAAFSGTPVCISAVQSATLTGGASGCTVSGTTVTITAASSNSLTWGALLIGNPN